MAEQIRLVDEAAERAVSEIRGVVDRMRAEAAPADSQTRASLLEGLAGALVERTESIRADCAQVSATLQKTTRLVREADRAKQAAAEPEPALAGSQAPDPERNGPLLSPESDELPVPTDTSEAETSAPRPSWLARPGGAPGTEPNGASEGVRLIATQMAIAGSSRTQIERRLRLQFGVKDAREALDEIFGSRQSGVG